MSVVHLCAFAHVLEFIWPTGHFVFWSFQDGGAHSTATFCPNSARCRVQGVSSDEVLASVLGCVDSEDLLLYKNTKRSLPSHCVT